MLVYRKSGVHLQEFGANASGREGRDPPLIFSPEHILGPRRGLMFFLSQAVPAATFGKWPLREVRRFAQREARCELVKAQVVKVRR